MPLPFSGPAVPLSPSDIAAAAARMGVRVEAVEAVMTVETGGLHGFLNDGSGRPRILFESKVFGDRTAHKWDVSHPLISTRVQNWKLYQGGIAEYGRLAEAVALDREMALEAASWGLFQLMGENWEMLGFHNVDEMVVAMAASEAAQLEAFVTYCTRNYLVQPLRDLDWARVARGYNGPNYAANQYDTKLAAAYAMACGRPAALMQIGCSGADVADLQRALTRAGYSLTPDGAFGRVTELALRRFQSMEGLAVDGIAGPATLAALHISMTGV